MKKLALISAIAFSGLLYNTADAQFGIHIGIHLFPHRVIYAPGPVVVSQAAVDQDATANVCDNDDDFYYLPDVGAYYSVTGQLYYYFDGQEWIAAACLPGVYHDYDWRYARRFEIRETCPYLHNDFYRDRYQGFDCDLAHNHDHFREGFDYRAYRDAYNAPQRFNDPGFIHRFYNNRSGYDQSFDERGRPGFDRRDNDNRQFSRDRYMRGFDDRDNGKTDRFVQNFRAYDGHRNGTRDRF